MIASRVVMMVFLFMIYLFAKMSGCHRFYVCRPVRSLSFVVSYIIISYSPSISSAVKPVIEMISFTSYPLLFILLAVCIRLL